MTGYDTGERGQQTVQNYWTLSEPSTWISEQPLQLSKDDERMVYASRAPSNRGSFQPRATALESMVAGSAAAASAAAAAVLAGDADELPEIEAWKSVQVSAMLVLLDAATGKVATDASRQSPVYNSIDAYRPSWGIRMR